MILLSNYKLYQAKRMNALLFIFVLIVIIFTFYVVFSLNNRGFSAMDDTNSSNIWKSFPSNYREGFSTIADSASPAFSAAPESYNDLDPFGLIDSSMDCPGSGYTNIKGNICLNDSQYMLLTTRGGNAKTGTKYQD
jgi:hypothetical protein